MPREERLLRHALTSAIAEPVEQDHEELDACGLGVRREILLRDPSHECVPVRRVALVPQPPREPLQFVLLSF